MTKRTRINAKMIIAFQAGEHRLLEDGCLIIEDDKIVFVPGEWFENGAFGE